MDKAMRAALEKKCIARKCQSPSDLFSRTFFYQLHTMKIQLLIVFLCAGIYTSAQNETVRKVAEGVSREALKKNLFYLASDQLEGRLMASRGDTLASRFIAAHFKESGLDAPYKGWDNYYQAVVYDRREFPVATLSMEGKNYSNWDGWYFSRSGMESVQLENTPVVFAGYNIEEAKYNDYENLDVKGKAVLVLSGQPRDSASHIYLLSGNTQPARLGGMLTRLKEKGAVALLVTDLNFTAGRNASQKNAYRPSMINHFEPSSMILPVLTISEERANTLLAAKGETVRSLQSMINKSGQPHSFLLNATVGIHIQMERVKTTAPNVIGVLKGSDPTAGYIIVSAHHDHQGKSVDGVYYGAVDNASGTVAIMEIARLMNTAVQKGQRPLRTIVFASFTGEEAGLLGSYYFAANPVYPISRLRSVLNIDMMGRVDTFYKNKRPDSNYAYILVKDSLNTGLRTALFNANDAAGNALRLDTWYEQPQYMQRRLLGSDQYPFFAKGVPFIRIDCGFCTDYHQLTDTPDKINYDLLQKQVKLAFLTAWNMAN